MGKNRGIYFFKTHSFVSDIKYFVNDTKNFVNVDIDFL